MKRATMTLPDDLAEAVERYVRAQEAPPALTTVVQAALREYLRNRGFLRPYRPLKITSRRSQGWVDSRISPSPCSTQLSQCSPCECGYGFGPTITISM